MTPTTIIRLGRTCLSAALAAALSACGGADNSAEQNDAPANAAAIAADAARMSSDDMHNEMSREGMAGQMKDDHMMMNEHHQMGMDKMGKMGSGNMPADGGPMSNMQSMPKDKPMPMKDDMGHM